MSSCRRNPIMILAVGELSSPKQRKRVNNPTCINAQQPSFVEIACPNCGGTLTWWLSSLLSFCSNATPGESVSHLHTSRGMKMRWDSTCSAALFGWNSLFIPQLSSLYPPCGIIKLF